MDYFEDNNPSSLEWEEPTCTIPCPYLIIVRRLLKVFSTSLGDMQAFYNSNMFQNEPNVARGMRIRKDEKGWDFTSFGTRRCVCFPPGDKDDPCYKPWIGYIDGDYIVLYEYASSGYISITPNPNGDDMELEEDENMYDETASPSSPRETMDSSVEGDTNDIDMVLERDTLNMLQNIY